MAIIEVGIIPTAQVHYHLFQECFQQLAGVNFDDPENIPRDLGTRCPHQQRSRGCCTSESEFVNIFQLSIWVICVPSI